MKKSANKRGDVHTVNGLGTISILFGVLCVGFIIYNVLNVILSWVCVNPDVVRSVRVFYFRYTTQIIINSHTHWSFPPIKSSLVSPNNPLLHRFGFEVHQPIEHIRPNTWWKRSFCTWFHNNEFHTCENAYLSAASAYWSNSLNFPESRAL
jgi:hypothetical protein